MMVVQGQQARRRHRRPPVHVRQLGHRCTRSASTTSSAARTTAPPAITSTSRATPPPASTPGRSSRAASRPSDLDHFRREIGRDGRGLSSYPHPRLMPDFWEFPTVSHGPRADHRAVPRPVQPLPAEPRARRHQPEPRVGVPRRRRVRRARDARRALARQPREARQPRLRRQLQPAAPRRSGARQRQDHPGARGRVPWRRVERHQGDLGLEVGRAARQRQGRRAAQPDEHHRRRRVPALRRRERRVHPRALLRARPAPAPDGGPPHRRGPRQPAPRRPRLPQALRRLQGGDREPRLGRADRDPLQDDQGLDARARLRGPQRHAPDQEDDQGAAARAARPPVPARRDPRVGARRRPPAVLPPGRGLDRVPVHDGAPPGARRLASPSASSRPQAPVRAAGRQRVRRVAQGLGRPGGVSTTMGFTRLLRNLVPRRARSASTSCRSSPTRPARSAWTRCSAN